MRSLLRIAAPLASCVVTFVAGCASRDAAPVTPRPPFANVEVVPATAVRPASCRYVALIEGRDEEPRDGLGYDDALFALRRAAALTGGNYVQIDGVEPHDVARDAPAFTIRGRLYACDAADLRPRS